MVMIGICLHTLRTTKTFSPTEGEMPASTIIMVTKTPNHTGSTPYYWVIGNIKGMVSTRIDVDSRMQPSIRNKTNMANNSVL